MAHFAELDENNVVTQVIVGVDEPLDGEAIYAETTGTVWKKTSYNTIAGEHRLGGTPFRKNYAGIGFTYDATRDAFIPPQPFASWNLCEPPTFTFDNRTILLPEACAAVLEPKIAAVALAMAVGAMSPHESSSYYANGGGLVYG